RDGRVQQERYWKYRHGRPSRSGERDLAHELAARLRTAVRRQLEGPGRVGMALSAGLDSRIIIAAAPEQPRLCCAYTTGYPGSYDVAGARELAAVYGVRHLHLVPQEGCLSATGPLAVWRTEGCALHAETTSPQFHDRLRPELDILLAGHAGGALSGQTLLPLLPGSPAHRDLDGYLFGRTLQLTPGFLRGLVAEGTWREHWPELRRRFSDTVEELDAAGRHPGDAVIEWNMERRQARFIHHAGQVDRDDFEIRAPLLDNDVVEFFLAVPYRYRFAQRLYKRTLAEAFPQAARVTWSKTGGPVPGRPLPILWQFYADGARKRLEKRFPALARGKKDRTRTLGVIAAEMRGDPAYRAEILDPFLSGAAFPDTLLNREAARRVVEEHWSGAANHCYTVACLATLALVYRHFLQDGLRAPESAPDHRLQAA
ncbi:MAG TPA: asparagine synthase C-terminal domain-containing protein, partial [Armatimonadota bacterium]|nr:asparagine synthase C-terminal domain-containing protein [Armatimonadota bacterium]